MKFWCGAPTRGNAPNVQAGLSSCVVWFLSTRSFGHPPDHQTGYEAWDPHTQAWSSEVRFHHTAEKSWIPAAAFDTSKAETEITEASSDQVLKILKLSTLSITWFCDVL